MLYTIFSCANDGHLIFAWFPDLNIKIKFVTAAADSNCIKTDVSP